MVHLTCPRTLRVPHLACCPPLYLHLYPSRALRGPLSKAVLYDCASARTAFATDSALLFSAIEIDPARAGNSYVNLGVAYRAVGDIRAAMGAYRAGIANGQIPEAYRRAV